MKVILKSALVMMMVIAAVTAYAQPPKGEGRHGHGHSGHGGPRGERPEQMAEMMSKRMSEELGLTDEQQMKIYTLEMTKIEKHRTARENAAQTRDDVRHNFEEEMKQHDAEMKAILTVEQYEKWSEMHSDRSRRDGHMRTKKEKRSKAKKNYTPVITD